MGFFDKLRRDKGPPPYRGLTEPEPTQKIPSPGATPATVKIPTSAPPNTAPPDTAAEATLYTSPSASAGKVVAVLIGVGGKLENEVYRIFDGPNKIGRHDDCEVTLPSKRISREHCLLTNRGAMFEIKPLSDRNPTRVNGEETEGTELSDGDELGIGDATFRFRTVDR